MVKYSHIEYIGLYLCFTPSNDAVKMKQLLFLLLLVPMFLQGQSIDHVVINTAGGTLGQGQVSLQSNVGELATTRVAGNQSVITQGIFQPEWQVLSSAEELFVEFGITIFPNPTQESFQITAERVRLSRVEIYNSQGQVVLQHQITEQPISLASLPDGMYYVKMIDAQAQTLGIYELLKI